MEPKQLEKIGKLLFGVRWKKPLADLIGVHRHTIEGLVDGSWKMSDEIEQRIRSAAAERIRQLQETLRK